MGKIKPLKFKYDELEDIMEIEGIKYSGAYFRELGEGGLPIGSLFRIVSRDYGVILERVHSNDHLGSAVN